MITIYPIFGWECVALDVIVDGQLTSLQNAHISFKDRGVLLGEGLFETIGIRCGKVNFFKQHWQRLEGGALKLGIELPFTFKTLLKDIYQLIKHHGLREGGLRLTLTAGISDRGLVAPIIEKGHYFIECFSFRKPLTPMRLCLSNYLRSPTDPLLQLKTLSYLTHVLEKKYAYQKGYDDVLACNTHNEVCETSCANFFLIKKGQIVTPPLSAGVLPGIIRAQVLNQCISAGIPIKVRPIRKEELALAEGAFITNALIGVVAVKQIESYFYAPSIIIEKISSMIFDTCQS